MFNNVQNAIDWIESQLRFRPKTSLDHMKHALSMLQLQLDNIKKIHVTGTNGKGSVCMMTTQVLVEAGYKVGTFISPYLVRFNERIKLNAQDIDDESLLISINNIYELNERYFLKMGFKLSFFELMTLMAFTFFSEMKVDVMVIEVGIGGLLDATNILNYDVSVITNIGLDHMKQLGDSLEQIATNKLGILKPGGHLITTVNDDLHQQFMRDIESKDATIKIIYDQDVQTLSEQPHIINYKNNNFQLSLLGDYQRLNAALAIEIVNYLYPNVSHKTINMALSQTNYPGRLETVLPDVVIDGAHNIHAIRQVIFSLKSLYKVYNIHVLFSALSDKESNLMLDELNKYAKSITLTAFPDPRYKNLDFLPYKFELNPKKALTNLIKYKQENDVILITGSLHFIGYMKKEVIPYLK